mmetsp:Transcript_21027/g.30018  ORF Transcript_21027/g.30018 Transcript_21027/m.30018 type:complete len:274 (-) Transcript_21027:278-1099(-)|eukprot:CAMPEP_0172421040 /NCGR_PEP_ID=MMETSP1064-20121228/7322_1 /TAXON_ID=202472 /ORGANISM="Aulacoseira subarctica , Strain CCAP 1002/5" /LENGTH=273 /DNA_ID=CAMNT_0013161243 /DNA_START=353 /DNA_END=1174 /DNA_ORIENTATION=+
MSSGAIHLSYQRSSSSATTNSTGSSCSENLAPRVLSRVAKEIRALHKEPPEGVRLVVEHHDGGTSSSSATACLNEIIAEIEGPVGTPYESKFFQLKLCLPSDFPASPPRGFFLTKIYHPNVEMSNGSICVNTLKRDWSDSTTLSHVLSVIRCLLIIPFPESSLNDEAGKFFMDSYDEYARRARLMADIHGRPKPCTSYLSELKKNDNSINDSSTDPLHKKTSVVCTADGAENRMDGGNVAVEENTDGGNKKATKDVKKAVVDKTKKKKSLKRL